MVSGLDIGQKVWFLDKISSKQINFACLHQRPSYSLREDIVKISKETKAASIKLKSISSESKNKALAKMSETLKKNSKKIISENKKDIKDARKKVTTNAFLDRLTLTQDRILQMCSSIEDVIRLDDPIGEIIQMWKRPNGLRIGKIRVPIGVIGIIYESRPNVTSDCIALCIKSGNAVLLRGGSSAINVNLCIFDLLKGALQKSDVPQNSINMVRQTSREAIDIMLELNTCIDLIIPRGGEELINHVVKKSHIPVLKHDKGLCHTFVDKSADINMAQNICMNAKVERPGVCNAMETLLVHKGIAGKFIPIIVKLFRDAGVEVRGCKKTKIICKDVNPATEEDWGKEYLDLIISIKVVSDIDEAIEHITTYSSKLSDAIITNYYPNAMRFLEEIDSACVYVNASTRFTDGYQFGLGAEMGISTDKLHARGPVGLKELTTYKYIILGEGQVRR